MFANFIYQVLMKMLGAIAASYLIVSPIMLKSKRQANQANIS